MWNLINGLNAVTQFISTMLILVLLVLIGMVLMKPSLIYLIPYYLTKALLE